MPYAGKELKVNSDLDRRADFSVRSNRPNGRKVGSRESEMYTRVYDAIVQHLLPPGTKLNETVLSEVFGVSRTTVRPTLARLAHEGMVDLEPNRGAFVARPSVKLTRDLFEVRRILECDVVAKLAPVLAEKAIKSLRRTVTQEVAAFQLNDVKVQLHLSGRFHLQLAEFSGNQVYIEIIKELISRTSLAIALYQAPETSGCRCEDHSHILACLETRDGAAASVTMSKHLSSLEDALNLDVEAPSVVDIRAVLSHASAAIDSGRRLQATRVRKS